MNDMKTTGKCLLCNEIMDEKTMRKHMRTCIETHAVGKVGGKPIEMVHLVVVGKDFPMYWLHLEVPILLTLDPLDSFLRDIWLECCGHMSAFQIGHDHYQSSCDGFDEDDAEDQYDMTCRMSILMKKGMHFTHAYDFGSTTELDLHVVDEWTRTPKRSGITLLARNQPPAWTCKVCGKPAKFVETLGFGIAPDRVYCTACAKKTEDPDCLLPIVNSPRTGVCCYE